MCDDFKKSMNRSALSFSSGQMLWVIEPRTTTTATGQVEPGSRIVASPEVECRIKGGVQQCAKGVTPCAECHDRSYPAYSAVWPKNVVLQQHKRCPASLFCFASPLTKRQRRTLVWEDSNAESKSDLTLESKSSLRGYFSFLFFS